MWCNRVHVDTLILWHGGDADGPAHLPPGAVAGTVTHSQDGPGLSPSARRESKELYLTAIFAEQLALIYFNS